MVNGVYTEDIIRDLTDAVNFKHAKREIEQLLNEDYEKTLIERLRSYDWKEKKLLAQIASEKAWVYVVENLQINIALRRHLEAWVQAVKKIGRTGRGKRALKYRRLAQEEMEYCKTSVPCWIMPLYKVTETIQPQKGIYDYVIVDESSQLGPDAIFLLYLSKNIIIVGDDKQTSPEYVGIDADKMSPFINKHLRGIPFKNFYGTEHSFFDHAKIFCEGLIVLREHFRCMPEIIDFSNRYFYAPEGKELYPLKQYSENRLEPLISVYCQSGYVEGKRSMIINKPEAVAITNKIKEIVNDPDYVNKTIGVICLQGRAQSAFIESLVIKEIGEKEYSERRIICGNSASFQGDERDIIFLSLVTAQNHRRSPLVRPEDERRFNVAASRAIEQMWLFHSVLLEDLSNTNDLRYKLIDHFINHKPSKIPSPKPINRTIGNQPEPFESWFEVDVFNDIVSKGYSVIPQYEVARGRYRIDLVAILSDGTKIAIECDGDKWHGADQYRNDLLRQKVLERCGWQFFRIRGGEYYSNRKKSLEPLWAIFNSHDYSKHTSENHQVVESHSEEVFASAKKTTINLNGNFDKRNTILNGSPQVVIKENESVVPIPVKDNKGARSLYINESHDDQINRYFNLNKTGNYVLTEKNPIEADYVVPIYNSQTNGYLLQCYISGHINKVSIKSLLSKKLEKQYMNGLNQKDKLVLLQAIDSEMIIGIYFIDSEGNKFKAHLTENISTREQLHLQGYKVIYNEYDRIEYRVYPIKLHNQIKRLVFQSFTAAGKLLLNKYYDNEWTVINSFEESEISHSNERTEDDSHDSSSTEIKVNTKVKIKYLKEDKIVTIEIVDRKITGVEIIDGIQQVSITCPLAKSLVGGNVGDEIKIGGTNTFIEIIDIMV